MKRDLEKQLNGGAVGPTLQNSLAGNESKIQVIISRISGIPVARRGSGDFGSIKLPLTDHQAK